MFAKTVKVTNIWADEAGDSHFRDIEFDVQEIPAGGGISQPINTNQLWFRTTQDAQNMDWHPTPRRQLVVIVSGGSAEVTTSDGEIRHFHPGDLLLVEDTFGKGHKTRAIEGVQRTSLFIGLESA